MTLSVKYRPWVACFLLILYGFIVVPVQLWHHHSRGTAQLSKDEKSLWSTVSKEVIGKIHDCKICSHSYSVFANDHARIELNIAIQPIFLATPPLPHLLEFAGPAFSNKGPPIFFS